MKIIVILSLAILSIVNCTNSKVSLVSTTSNEPWVKVASVNLEKADTSKRFDLIISTSEKTQVIDAFGGFFNELGWDAFKMLDSTKKAEVLKGLFTPDGLNFILCRMPIGANDYARNYYSLNDSASDFEMKYFNIDRDKKNLVPYIKMATQYCPQLKIWGSPGRHLFG